MTAETPGYGHDGGYQYQGYAGQPVGVPVLPPGWTYASYGSRAGALLLDALLLFLFLLPSGIVLGLLASLLPMDDSGGPTLLFALLMICLMGASILAWLYQYVWRTGTRGQSLGKQVMGIYVLKADTLTPLGGGMGILRYVVVQALNYVTCSIGTLVDYLWPLWDVRSQTLHDKIVSSVVVRPPTQS
ncbi:MAG: hypothetical protein QG622_3747 [Actinomycetota bacterium]|nr:hypothetical protein [Actinomycetota bacterium]